MALDNPRRKSTRERDRDPDAKIGVTLPIGHGREGFFRQSNTLLQQTISNLKNLLLTVKGERVAQPTFGSNIYNILFDNYTTEFDSQIESTIKESVATWLPHVLINNIIIDSQPDNNMVRISVVFSIVTDPNATESLTLSLRRST